MSEFARLPLLRYGIVPLAVAVAMLLRLPLWPILEEELAFLFLWPAVLFCAWYGGLGPGLLATLLASVSASLFLLEPRLSFAVIRPADFLGLMTFVSLCVVFSVLNEKVHQGKRRLEQTVREVVHQREWLRVTLSSIGDAVIATDPEGRVTFLNPTAQLMTGWSDQAARGQPLTQVFPIIHEETRAPAENPVAKVLRDGVVVGLANHTALVARDGTEHPIEDSAAPIRGDDGRVIGVILVFHDVSERKQAERALRQSEEELRTSFELAAVGMVQVDPATGRFLRVNRKFCEIVGYPPEEACRLTVRDLTHPEDREDDWREVRCMLEGEASAYASEKRYVRKDGEVVWVDVTASLVRDVDGRPLRSIGVVRDLTAQRLAERAKQESEERLRALIDNLPHGVIYQAEQAPDGSVRFLYMSAGIERLFGVMPEEVTGDAQNFYGLIIPEDLPRMLAERAVALQNRSAFDCQFRLRSRSGVVRWVHGRSGPRQLLSGTTVWEGVLVDITDRKQAEEALSESRRRLQAIFDNALDAILLADDQGRYLAANPAACEVLGYDREELLARTVGEINPAPDAAVGRGLWQDFIRQGQQRGEVQVVRKGGTTVRVEYRAVANILPGLHLSVLRDVSERQRATEALLASEQRLRAIIDNWPAFVFVKDLQGRYLLANRACEAVTGKPSEQIVGKTDYDYLPREVADRFRASDRQVMETQAVLRFEETAPVGGENRTTLAAKFPLFDTAGKFSAVCGIATDITDLKNAQETVGSLLRLSEKLNSSLDADTLLDVLVQEAIRLVNAESGVAGLLTPKGMVTQRYFQKGTAVPLEYCWPSLHGLPGWVIVHKVPYLTNDAVNDPQMSQELCAKFGVRSALCTPILNAEKQLLGYFEIHNKRDGAEFTPADQEKLVAVSQVAAVAVQNALAYRQVRQAEDALKKADRRKDEFLNMLAHELRNPLAPIRNAVEVVRMLGDQDGRLRRARDTIERQVQHLSRLVNDLLDVSRITRGKVTLQKERLDLAWVTRAAVEDFQPVLAAAGLELSVSLPELPVWVEGDRTRLPQVLDNLLQNSLKFTEPGGRVFVRVEAEGDRAVVRVRDTGAGIDPELLANLFQPFSQADRSLARTKGGLGLGLALVKGLAELHDGEVQAFSPGSGQGTEIVVRLPLQPEPAAVTQGPTALRAGNKGLRVLVVEDNEDSAESLRMLLELFGHEVAVAYTGLTGVETAQRWHPEVVLCDIGLPGMDGYGVVRELRGRPETAQARVIAVTGYGTDEDRRRSLEAGFDLHLTKPVDPETLAQVVCRPGSPA